MSGTPLTDLKRPPHWYCIHWCPVCGKEERVRIYGEKPDDPALRYSQTYCGCLDSQFA